MNLSHQTFFPEFLIPGSRETEGINPSGTWQPTTAIPIQSHTMDCTSLLTNDKVKPAQTY
jgi:hypothetical protein